jgi:hypothetical protein
LETDQLLQPQRSNVDSDHRSVLPGEGVNNADGGSVMGYNKSTSGTSRYRVNALLQRARITLALRKKQRSTMGSGIISQTDSMQCESRPNNESFGASQSSTRLADGDISVTPRSLRHSSFSPESNLAQQQSDWRSSANNSPVGNVGGDSANGSTISNTTRQWSCPVTPASQSPATPAAPLSQPGKEELFEVVSKRHASYLFQVSHYSLFLVFIRVLCQ